MDIAVVGLDGVDPDRVREWRDDLPTLSDLIADGTFGSLDSSKPPLSSPAWQWMYTGKQGGRHGCFGFTQRDAGSYDRVPINHDDVTAALQARLPDARALARSPAATLATGYLGGHRHPSRLADDQDRLGLPADALSTLRAAARRHGSWNAFVQAGRST